MGFCAVSCPVGFTDDGLPLSVQLVGVKNTERILVEVAEKLSEK